VSQHDLNLLTQLGKISARQNQINPPSSYFGTEPLEIAGFNPRPHSNFSNSFSKRYHHTEHLPICRDSANKRRIESWIDAERLKDDILGKIQSVENYN